VHGATTISSSFITCTGLKKCVPITRSGYGSAAAITDIDSELVLVARIAVGATRAATGREQRVLELELLGHGLDHDVRPRHGGRQHRLPAQAASAAPRCSAVSLPRATPPSRFARTLREPSPRPARCGMSKRRVVRPAAAATWAMPWPIVPAPSTATVVRVEVVMGAEHTRRGKKKDAGECRRLVPEGLCEEGDSNPHRSPR
jgi:hypothetical protein